MSVLTKHQKKTREKRFTEDGKPYLIIAEIRFDDECGNGHNSFAITGEIWRATKTGHRLGNDCEMCGCIHEEISEHFPDLVPFLKWRLTSTDGPMHYIANTLYFIQKGELDAARRSAVWLDATDEDLLSPDIKQKLEYRLPQLLEEFQRDMESLGFTY